MYGYGCPDKLFEIVGKRSCGIPAANIIALSMFDTASSTNDIALYLQDITERMIS